MIRRMLAVALSAGLVGATVPSPVRANDELPTGKIKHVLLISVDGLHALDLSNYVNTHGDSTLAELSHHGYTYTNAAASNAVGFLPGTFGPGDRGIADHCRFLV